MLAWPRALLLDRPWCNSPMMMMTETLAAVVAWSMGLDGRPLLVLLMTRVTYTIQHLLSL